MKFLASLLTPSYKSGENCIDLCKIIEQCGRSNVGHIKIDGIAEIVFKNSEGITTTIDAVSQDLLAKKVYTVDNKDNVEEESEFDLDELAITDPLAYERIMNGGLKDV